MDIEELTQKIEEKIEANIEAWNWRTRITKTLEDNIPLQRNKLREIIETEGIITPLKVVKQTTLIKTKLTGPITSTRRKDAGTIEHRGGQGRYIFRITNQLYNTLRNTWLVVFRSLGNLKGEWGEPEMVIQEKIGEQQNQTDYALDLKIPVGYAGAYYTVLAVDTTDQNTNYKSEHHDLIMLKGEEPPPEPPGEPPEERPPPELPGEPYPITIASSLGGPIISTRRKSEKEIEHRGKPGKYTFSGRGAFFINKTKNMRLWIFRSKGTLRGQWTEPEQIRDISLKCRTTIGPLFCLRRNIFKTFAVNLDLGIPFGSAAVLYGLIAVDPATKTRGVIHYLFQFRG